MRKASSPFSPPACYNVNLGKKEIEDAIHVFVELSGKVVLANDWDQAIRDLFLPATLLKAIVGNHA